MDNKRLIIINRPIRFLIVFGVDILANIALIIIVCCTMEWEREVGLVFVIINIEFLVLIVGLFYAGVFSFVIIKRNTVEWAKDFKRIKVLWDDVVIDIESASRYRESKRKILVIKAMPCKKAVLELSKRRAHKFAEIISCDRITNRLNSFCGVRKSADGDENI